MAVITTRTNALNTVANLEQAGVVFNDATRLLEGGLWNNVVLQANQTPTLGEYTADMNAVLADLKAVVAAGGLNQMEKCDIAAIENLIPALLTAATTSVNSNPGAVQTAAENVLHNDQLQIINIVHHDPALLAAANATGQNGFALAPAAFAPGTTAANAPVNNLAEIGALFNDASNHLIGGLNTGNMAVVQADLTKADTGLQNLITNDPQLFGQGLTLIHAQTIVNQLNLQINNFDHQYGVNVDAARATNDNINDINDIIAADINLVNNATQGGVTGFTPLPNFLTGTVHKFQDNADQTQFWANFIVGANTLTTQANAIANNGFTDANAITALINQVNAYQAKSANFDMGQGGIFEARFDNELATGGGTLSADTAAMIKGLQSHNATLVAAAGQGFIADAADVSGNNVPVTGGTFNGAGTTVAQVLSTAHTAIAMQSIVIMHQMG